jgi:hypothetical protein
VLIPAEALNGDDRFIDDMPRSELASSLPGVEIRAGHEVTEALRAS